MGGGDTTDTLILPRVSVNNTLAFLDIFFETVNSRRGTFAIISISRLGQKGVERFYRVDRKVMFYVSCEIHTTEFQFEQYIPSRTIDTKIDFGNVSRAQQVSPRGSKTQYITYKASSSWETFGTVKF